MSTLVCGGVEGQSFAFRLILENQCGQRGILFPTLSTHIHGPHLIDVMRSLDCVVASHSPRFF
jgi:hypothetical protein